MIPLIFCFVESFERIESCHGVCAEISEIILIRENQ